MAASPINRVVIGVPWCGENCHLDESYQLEPKQANTGKHRARGWDAQKNEAAAAGLSADRPQM
jgi:hypothetical protein